MGLMTISGSLAAIHAIFSNLSIRHHYSINPQGNKNKLWWGKIKIILAGIAISSLMAGGMAGDERLEIFTKSVLLLWLISYALLFLSNLFTKSILDNNTNLGRIIKSSIIGLILFISILMLIITDQNVILIIEFLAVSFLVILIFWVFYYLKKPKEK